MAVFTIFSGKIMAQYTVSGKVFDGDTNDPLVGANVVIEGTSTGVTTDLNGEFKIEIPTNDPSNLIISFVGYLKESVLVDSNNKQLRIVLKSDVLSLGTVMVTGSRFKPRTIADSPVPIDNIKIEDMQQTGQFSVDKMLTYTVPSYNSTNQTISDATAHFDPADLRNLGPSRTLVLVNGKRKNASALVYVNETPGRGEVGVDMKSIPAAAIERVEVLRDGASAQYGSDAIAGVVNIILKEETEQSKFSVNSGITTEGDGFRIGSDFNTGFEVGNNGFINVTASFYDQQRTNRPGTPGEDVLFGVGPDNSWIQQNPDLGMTVGIPELTSSNAFYNSRFDLKGGASLYSFGGITLRKGTSYAIYRTPYWVPDPFNLLHESGTTYQGFQPTFNSDILDNTLTIGIDGERNGWGYDISLTSGRNEVDYTIGNTLNPSLGADSPTNFRAGGYEFGHTVSNLDVGKQFGNLVFSAGTEIRFENFVATAGEEASYVGGGAQSFPGLQPSNEEDAIRYNVGVYADLAYDVSDNLLIGGAVRYENYSDFGSNVNWKFNARYKMLDDILTLRSSVSTGFRAPSLHQIYFSNVQTLVVDGQLQNEGTFNNLSPVVRSLGVPKLKQEKSFNITAGIASNFANNFSFSLDYYHIEVDDRIVFSSQITSNDTTSAVGSILNQQNISALKFFINGANTVSDGVDLVIGYDNIILGAGDLSLTLAANYNNMEINGTINTPAPIEETGINIFNREERSRITSARPQDKVLLGITYKIGDFTATLNNTRFGEVTWRHPEDPDKDQVFSAKIITDLNMSYKFNDNLGATLGVNNLFDVYPDEIDPKGDPGTDLGGRFRYPWEVNQFGFMGTMVQAGINLKF
ncbi:TonB-dependent receptor [Marivirga sp.]|uniref:TonB-dependent receptor n=1 Tax=Marivirga sp. TaxID=2018662 RepID=UPI0025E269B3|nr:TonB-dependent receptor [Marivirga sp.]